MKASADQSCSERRPRLIRRLNTEIIALQLVSVIDVLLEDLSLLIDLHVDGDRQGPGSDACTNKALQLTGLNREQSLWIADLGCGTGASAMVLAEELNAKVLAVDSLQPLPDVLNARSVERGIGDWIETIRCSMHELPFEDQSLDVIWSEDAI